jgi:hypothetical protein
MLTGEQRHARAQSSLRCSEWIEVEWPGHRCVLSRSQCRNLTRHKSGKCHQHQPYQPPPAAGPKEEMK